MHVDHDGDHSRLVTILLTADDFTDHIVVAAQ
jgi:hypothetical protein